MSIYSMKEFIKKLTELPMVACHTKRLKDGEVDTVQNEVTDKSPVNVRELRKLCEDAFGCKLIHYEQAYLPKDCIRIGLRLEPGHWAFREPFTLVIERRLKKTVDATGEVWKRGDYARLRFERKGFGQSTELTRADDIDFCADFVRNFLDSFIGSDGLTMWERGALKKKFNNFLDSARKLGIEISGSYKAKRRCSWDASDLARLVGVRNGRK